MKETSLEYRIFRASLIYVLAMMLYGIGYRFYHHEYWIVLGYTLFWLITLGVWIVSNNLQKFQRIIRPWIVFIFILAILLWLKTGGVGTGSLLFFTAALTLIIISPKTWRNHLVFALILTQIVLVVVDVYINYAPDFNISLKQVWDYTLFNTVNLSVIWMLKNNYDAKEEKVNKFSQGLRELHRLSLKHTAKFEDILEDYLNTGQRLLSLKRGLIVETHHEILQTSLFSPSSEDSAAISARYQEIIEEVQKTSRTLYSTRKNNNLNPHLIHLASLTFIATPVVADDVFFGVLVFFDLGSDKEVFQQNEIEIAELLALNISHLFNIKLWQKNQQASDRALRISEERFKSIYDYASVGICVCDKKGRILMANRAIQDLYGYSEDEMRLNTFDNFSTSNWAEEDLKKYQQVVRGEIDYYKLEKTKKTKHGRWIDISKTVSPIKDEHGEILYTIVINEDITERKNHEKKIHTLNEELAVQVEKMEVANKELEAFSYSVSHDLRAPLRAIDGFSKIILEDHQEEFSDESQRLLQVIIKNSGKMATLIDDLLLFSRMSRKITEFKPVDLYVLITSIIEEQALDRQVFYIESELPQVKGEKTLLKQLLSNLIGNAVKFSSKNNTPKIEIGYVSQNECHEFFIKDNGVGFDMKYYDKIFGVFQRLHTDEEFKGTGVGLAIVQKVILKHHGKVWAESQEGEGTTFYFSLPK